MAEGKIHFQGIVKKIFSNWTALKMAVEHGMGSVLDARIFCDYIAEILSLNDQQMHFSDIAGELEDYLDDRFNTRVEDSSADEVAKELVKFHLWILKKDEATLQTEFERLPPLQYWIEDPMILKKVESSSESDSDDEEMETDHDDEDTVSDNKNSSNKSKGGMEVDEDGWTVVKRK